MPETSPPPSPLGVTNVLGGFWHLSQLKFEEISQKLQNNADFKKHAPPPIYLPPWESKLFWEVSHLSQLIFEEISPKMPRMQILTKLVPQLPQLAPLRKSKIFLEAYGIYLSSSLKKYHQNCKEC